MSCSIARLSSSILLTAALVADASAQRVSQHGLPRRSPAIVPIVLDFETEDDSVSPLANGQSVSAPEEFGRLVSISSTGANAGPAIFDSRPDGPNDPSQDPDLLVGLGNVLILQNSLVPGQTTPGIFDRPNDDQDGGELVFDFETPVEPLSLVLIDIDAGATQGVLVTLTDELGRTRTYTVPQRWTRDVVADGVPGWGLLSFETLDPQPGFQSSATATQVAGFDSSHVVRLVVRLGSSGAVDALQWKPGRAVGMLASREDNRVVVFDADLDQVLGSVAIPFGAPEGVAECVIDVRRSLGYVTDFASHVWVIDLAASPLQLASGINPIPLTILGIDLALSPDGRFLAVTGGEPTAPLLIVDPETRTVVGSAPVDCTTVDFSSNDSLVAASWLGNRLRRFTLDAGGTPSLAGEVVVLREPTNLTCAPGGRVGVLITSIPSQIRSFEAQSLAPVEQRSISISGQSVCFTPDGRRLFDRSASGVRAWAFDPLTGAIGAAPLYAFHAHIMLGAFLEKIVVHPDGSRLYVPNRNAIRIHDPADGALIGTLPTPGVVRPTGIAVERGLR